MKNCPIKINGSSTGHIPIHDKINHEFISIRSKIFIGRQNLLADFLIQNRLGKYKTKIANKRAITPPSIFGIDRRITHNHKKYHSG